MILNGCAHRPGIDYDETFSLVIKLATFWTVLSLAISHHWHVHQLNVKNDLHHGHLQETIYMHQRSMGSMIHRVLIMYVFFSGFFIVLNRPFRIGIITLLSLSPISVSLTGSETHHYLLKTG